MIGLCHFLQRAGVALSDVVQVDRLSILSDWCEALRHPLFIRSPPCVFDLQVEQIVTLVDRRVSDDLRRPRGYPLRSGGRRCSGGAVTRGPLDVPHDLWPYLSGVFCPAGAAQEVDATLEEHGRIPDHAGTGGNDRGDHERLPAVLV